MEDDLTARNPAPNFVPAVGMKTHIVDIDADGRNDAVICGKGACTFSTTEASLLRKNFVMFRTEVKRICPRLCTQTS